MTPAEVIGRAHALVRTYDIGFVDCFAPDGVLELPFAPPCVPRRLEGREAIRGVLQPRYEAARAAGRKILGYRAEVLHATADPEVAVYEFSLDGAEASGAGGALRFIHVYRVRNDQIVEMRDYFDSFRMNERWQAARAAAGAPSPRQVFERLVAAITAGRWSECADFYAEDAVVTHPHDVPLPTRQEGREALRAHFAKAAQLPITIAARNIVVHETSDPEVIVAELDYLGRVTTNERTFQISNVFVIRVRDGLIVTSRDYGNRLALDRALG